MKKILCAMILGLALSANAHAGNAQQEKMKTCNADATAKGLKGDERKTFMSSCLGAKPQPTAAQNAQQEKMKKCNADAKAKGIKGDERKKFMSTCLSG
jgi:hypothetical protein